MTELKPFPDKSAIHAALDALDQANQLQIATDLTAGLRVGGKSRVDALTRLNDLARRYSGNDGAAGAILNKVQALTAQMDVPFDLAELLSRVRSG